MLFVNIIFSNFKNNKIVFCFLVVKHIIPLFFLENIKLFLKLNNYITKQILRHIIGTKEDTIACGATTNEWVANLIYITKTI